MQTGINIDSMGFQLVQTGASVAPYPAWGGGVWFAPQLLLCCGVVIEDPEVDGPWTVEGAVVCECSLPQTLVGLSYTCSGCGLRGATTRLTHAETII